jgi:heterodisulfide reductase subunit A-like polyferredoxin
MEASAAQEVSPQVMIVGGGVDGLSAAKELAGRCVSSADFKKLESKIKMAKDEFVSVTEKEGQ